MTVYSDPREEITGSEDIIRAVDVRTRLATLHPWFTEDENGKEVASFSHEQDAVRWIALQDDPSRYELYSNGDEPDEQAALRELLGQFPAQDSYAVNDSYLEDYAREEAEGIAGREAICMLESYIRWDDFAAALSLDMTETMFRGSTYYIKG